MWIAENNQNIKTAENEVWANFKVIRCRKDPEELECVFGMAIDLDALNGRIKFNVFVWRVLVALIPLAILIGAVLGKQ